jgi:hypothetical protein
MLLPFNKIWEKISNAIKLKKKYGNGLKEMRAEFAKVITIHGNKASTNK